MTNKSVEIAYMITTLTVEEAVSNPATLHAEKNGFKLFSSFENAKYHILPSIHKKLLQDKNSNIDDVIWRINSANLESFMTSSNTAHSVRNDLKSLSISEQWIYDTYLGQFVLEPIIYGDETSDLVYPQENETPLLNRAYQPPKITHITFNDPIKGLDGNTLPKNIITHLKNDIERIPGLHDILPIISCPLSTDIFENCVITPDGYSYNAAHISEYIDTHQKDPESLSSLTHMQLVDNITFMKVLFHLRDIMRGSTYSLLCPITKLPLNQPILINPSSANGQELLAAIHPNKNALLFEDGISFNYSSLLIIKDKFKDIIALQRIKKQDLIPNRSLLKLIKALVVQKTRP